MKTQELTKQFTYDDDVYNVYDAEKVINIGEPAAHCSYPCCRMIDDDEEDGDFSSIYKGKVGVIIKEILADMEGVNGIGWIKRGKDAWNVLEKNCCIGLNLDSLKDIVESKQISIDNGLVYLSVDDLFDQGYLDDEGLTIDEIWDALVNLMEDEAREKTHAELAPCTKREFLTRYLELATEDLIFG